MSSALKTTKLIRPLRAARADEAFANSMLFRDWAYSVKIDGIRVLNIAGTLYTRKMEVVPNIALQTRFGGLAYDGFDGEMFAGNWNKTQSLLSTADMPLDDLCGVTWHIFDDTTVATASYDLRYEHLKRRVLAFDTATEPHTVMLARHWSFDGQTPISQMETFTAMGYEGLIVRRWDKPYKFGEATLKGGELIKVKPQLDAEATCTGFVESLRNDNALARNNLGLAKRSSRAANKTPLNTLGTLLGTWVNEAGVSKGIKVSSGITAQEAKEIWDNQEKFLGRSFTFSYMEETVNGLPRHAVFKGWRED